MGTDAGPLICSTIPALISPLGGGNAMLFKKGFEPGVKAVHPGASMGMIYTGLFTALKASQDLTQAQTKAKADIRRISAFRQTRAAFTRSEYV